MSKFLFRFSGRPLGRSEKDMIKSLVTRDWKKGKTIIARKFKKSALFVGAQSPNGKSRYAKLVKDGKLNKYQILWIWHTKHDNKDKRHWMAKCLLTKKIIHEKKYVIINIEVKRPNEPFDFEKGGQK